MATKLLEWKSDYNLGIKEIDHQHRSLVDLVNQIWESIIFRADREKVFDLVEQLERYTIAHFIAEEVYMQAVRYPDFEEHKRIHQQFIARVEAEKLAAIKAGQLSLSIVNYLKQWLLDHILGADKAFAGYANKVQVIYQQEEAPSKMDDEKAGSLLRRIFKRYFT